MEHGPIKIKEDLSLKMGEDGRALFAEFPESPERERIQLTWFQEQLSEHGLDRLRLNYDVIGQCLTEYNNGTTASTVLIGEAVDAEYSITISDDLMQAQLNYTPPQGGEAVTKQQILNALTKQGITFGIQEDAIDSSLASEEGVHNQIIAQGEPAVDGDDGSFEKIVDDICHPRPPTTH